jgi:EAL domain-containing protein (putative c-di-GMP-specific phosphodiesterase class I)
MSLKALFDKELIEIQRQEVRDLREALRRTETKLATHEQAAINTLRLYGFEAVQRYKDKVRESTNQSNKDKSL